LAAKNQPPILSRLSPQADARWRCRPIILPESGIAAQTFPSQTRYLGSLKTVIKV
jgi:hypothetical protein